MMREGVVPVSDGAPGWFGLPHSYSFLPRRNRPLEIFAQLVRRAQYNDTISIVEIRGVQHYDHR